MPRPFCNYKKYKNPSVINLPMTGVSLDGWMNFRRWIVKFELVLLCFNIIIFLYSFY